MFTGVACEQRKIVSEVARLRKTKEADVDGRTLS